MDRDYKTGKSTDVGVFSGLEIEHTPAYGKQTLFLARNDLVFDQIEELAKKVKAEAIYFGANRTFMPHLATQITQMMKLLDPHAIHDQVKENFRSVWKHEKFIPFCSVIFPNSEGDDNLCIKIDDIDFNKTNPGVWTMTMDHFKQTAGFTSWDEYKQDEPIEENNVKKVV
jgi:hypothetical protein